MGGGVGLGRMVGLKGWCALPELEVCMAQCVWYPLAALVSVPAAAAPPAAGQTTQLPAPPAVPLPPSHHTPHPLTPPCRLSVLLCLQGVVAGSPTAAGMPHPFLLPHPAPYYPGVLPPWAYHQAMGPGGGFRPSPAAQQQQRPAARPGKGNGNGGGGGAGAAGGGGPPPHGGYADPEYARHYHAMMAYMQASRALVLFVSTCDWYARHYLAMMADVKVLRSFSFLAVSLFFLHWRTTPCWPVFWHLRKCCGWGGACICFVTCCTVWEGPAGCSGRPTCARLVLCCSLHARPVLWPGPAVSCACFQPTRLQGSPPPAQQDLPAAMPGLTACAPNLLT